MNYFNPPVKLKKPTGPTWDLGISNDRLVLVNSYRGSRPLVNAQEYIVVERQPVAGGLMKIIAKWWNMSACQDADGNRHAGGIDVLQEAEAVLRSAGLLDDKGVACVEW